MSTSISFTNVNFTKDSDGNITGASVPVTIMSDIDSTSFAANGKYSLSLEELTEAGFDVSKFNDFLSQKAAENLSTMASDVTSSSAITSA